MLQYFDDKTREMKNFLPGHTVEESLWYDLFNPSVEEKRMVEEVLHLALPSVEEMNAIESSSRLHQEGNNFFYMTINLVASADSEYPVSSPVTLILSDKYLITLRSIEFKSFQNFMKVVKKNFKEAISAELLFLALLETIIDRLADIIEMIGGDIDALSMEIFTNKSKGATQQIALKDILARLGKRGDLSAKVRVSLENVHRLLHFVSVQVFTADQNAKHGTHLAILQQDVVSIIDHLTFIFHKTNFLLDATLGLIHIEQNSIVKILSVAAVIFLPPMLLGTIYGMNFTHMPELHFAIGYPIALLLMVISSVVSYIYCKWKGWLS